MTTRTRKHWTQEDIQKLVALTEEGTSNADNANQLDCTAHSLKKQKTQLRKAGILPPFQAEIEFSPEQLEESPPPFGVPIARLERLPTRGGFQSKFCV